MPLILSGSAGLSGNVGNVTKDMLPAGSVLQVVQVVKTDTWAVSATTFTDVAGMVASITPSSLTNKILVLVDLSVGASSGEAAVPRLLRDSTPIYVPTDFGARPAGLAQVYTAQPYFTARSGGTYLDSPNTIAPVTYKLQMLCTGGSSVQYVNRSNADRASNTYDARTASSITLMEIKA